MTNCRRWGCHTLGRERYFAAARARGGKGGRPTALDCDKRDVAVRLYKGKSMPIVTICTMLGVSKQALYGYVRVGFGIEPRRPLYLAHRLFPSCSSSSTAANAALPT